MPNPFFSGRIPPELLEKVEEHIAKTGESKTQVLVKALADYVDHLLPVSSSPSVIDEMLSRLDTLEAQLGSCSIEKIAMLEQTIQDLQQQIEALRQKPRKDPLDDIFERHYGNGSAKTSK